MTAKIPSPGQIVRVRQHRYVVREVRKSALGGDPLRGPLHTAQHLVDLASVEDDGHGEELQVVWELEPGAHVFERASLPEVTGFDDPARLDAFLDAVRWGAVSSADTRTLQAPFRAGIAIEDYQLDPVVRALRMPRVNLLVADDTGLGKTIEAGLVVQELLLRHRARSVLVVCPAGLCIKWREEMREKFGLEFRIVDRQLMADLRRRRGIHVNPWTHFPRLITSIDFLKREQPFRLMREVLPAPGEPAFPRRFDLLIVDEAHNIAPAGSGVYALDSQRTATIRTLAPHFEHRLFLTATPHNGYSNSFAALLELIDDQRFHRTMEPDPQQLAAVMVRRLKRELPKTWDGRARFPERDLLAVPVTYPAQDREAHADLARYVQLRVQHTDSATARFATEFVLKLLKKRMFSCPQAFLLTLDKHIEALNAGAPSRPARAAAPTLGVLRRRLEGIEEEFADDDAYEEATVEGLDEATRLLTGPSAEEQNLLYRLRQWATDAARAADAKAAELLAWIEANLRPGGAWNGRRLLIFTEYRATQKWLHQLFAGAGLTRGGRLLTLYGGMDEEERETVKAAFQASPDASPVRILLATDAASEGIDLQNHCADLFHYEIPWNPNRLEQRNGRIDRHGQRAERVRIHHFVGAPFDASVAGRAPGELAGDLEFLMRAALKVDRIREDLGKVGPVLAAQVEEAMLGRRIHLDTRKAESEAEPARRLLKLERKIAEELQRLHDQLHDTRRQLHLTPEAVEQVVRVGLELAGQPPLLEAPLVGVWPDPKGRRSCCPVFRIPVLRGESWGRCREGLSHPHTGEERPIVFDHDLAAGRDDVVLVHLAHPLVQLCLHLLRAEIWRPTGEQRLHRVTARQVGRGVLADPAVAAHGRLVVLGSDGTRLHEELVVAGGRLREGRFARLNVGEVQAALDAALPEQAPEALGARLAELWPGHRDALLAALEARQRDKLNGMQRLLEERRDKEIADLTAVLQELARQIEEQLHHDDGLQLELFDSEAKAQRDRERATLLPRFQAIPAEIERETAAIRARYADPTPRLFPVAITYLVPQEMCR